MKQIFVCTKNAYLSGKTLNDISGITKGVVGIFNLKDGSLATAKPTTNFAIVVGNGNAMPRLFPEVDVNTLTVEKASYTAGATYKATITVPTPVKGNVYTVMISKTGVVFNERNNWTFTTIATNTTAADVASALVKQINANSESLGVTAANTAGAITITAVNEGDNYNLQGADTLFGSAITSVTVGKKAVLDKAYVEDMASRCAAGRGFNDNDEGVNPGYPIEVADEQYVMYTLRFAVPRVAAKQRDEVIYQTVYICIPSGAGAITTLDLVLGLTEPTVASGVE